jgi:hypothetical protein
MSEHNNTIAAVHEPTLKDKKDLCQDEEREHALTLENEELPVSKIVSVSGTQTCTQEPFLKSDDINVQLFSSDEQSSVGSSESNHSFMELRFQLHSDAIRFMHFVHYGVIFASMYTLTASTAFFSSLYPVAPTQELRHSTVDSFLLSSAIIAIDISSAFFVVTGFFCAYTLTNITSSDKTTLFRIIVLYTIVDVWLATFVSVIFGSIFHAFRKTFAAQDITLTLLEGITCMRTFELSQSTNAMHSMNPTSWPILCLLYCFLLTPWTMVSNHRLHSCYPRAGLILLLVNALAPIVTISLFALLHEDTNIFFINSTHFGYRLLEFNVGVCFFACVQSYPLASTKFTYCVNYLHPLVTIVFFLIWWAQLGAPVQPNYGTCIRMYNFSPCIRMHHGFLMRGCFLGITILCKIMLTPSKQVKMFDVVAHGNAIDTQGSWLACGVTALVFVWPMCYIVHLILELNFNVSLVHENSALLVIIVPIITWGVASLWNNTWKLTIVNCLDKTLDRVSACLLHTFGKSQTKNNDQNPSSA